MAPLPVDSTARLFVDYSVAGYQHTSMIRYGTGVTPQEAMDDFAALVDALDTQLYQSTLVGARFAADGSTVTVPFTGTAPAGWGGSAAAGDESARYYDWVGRSVGGRRVRFSLFGATTLQDSNLYRINGGVSVVFDAATAILLDAEGTFLAIDGTQPIWHTYVNTGVNAYWRNKIR